MRLTNRGICNYFKERIEAKSHKSDEVNMGQCVTIEFKGDPEESERAIYQGFPQFSKMADYLLISESLGMQIGDS